jgi:hypothetical protein
MSAEELQNVGIFRRSRNRTGNEGFVKGFEEILKRDLLPKKQDGPREKSRTRELHLR